MKKPMVDHWWEKITERSSMGLAATKDKLEQVEYISAKIQASDGSDAVRNVMDNGMIKLALQRCLQFHKGDDSITDLDLHIYYRYATMAAKQSEAIIDDELDYLEL
ncbi:hypothetical protein ALP94_04651 [Pseudomonas savastanoi pv. glycinea]|nr:hypothetical protein ALP94_04651 [Pseudomonas savastanoi pv. glycinea]